MTCSVLQNMLTVQLVVRRRLSKLFLGEGQLAFPVS